MKINKTYLLAICALCLLFLGVTAMRDTATTDVMLESKNDSIPTRRQLRRIFFEKRAVLVVYGTKNKELASKYRSLLDKLSQSATENSWRNVSVSFKEVSEVGQTELEENILFLVGTSESNPLLKKYSHNVPVAFNTNAIQFNKKEYGSNEMLLSISFYPNPETGLPVGFLSGNDEGKVFDFFKNKVEKEGRSFFRQHMDYEIYRNDSRVVMGNFSSEWGLDGSTYFDYSSGNTLVHTSEHFDFIDHQNAMEPEAVITMASTVEKTMTTVLNFVGSGNKIPRFGYHIYKNAEEKGLMVGNTTQAHFDSIDNSVHTIVNDKYKDNFIEKENALLIHHLLGTAKTRTLTNGLPIYFTDQWQREGYRYWSARLFTSGNALSLRELFDTALVEIESPLLVDCMSASLVGFLLQEWGKKTFLERYTSWVPTPQEIRNLEPKWKKYLSQNSTMIDEKKKNIPKMEYLKGFNFAHEGYSIYNGYLSQKATEALEKQKSLGSNAIAIVPYSYMRDKNRPTPFRFSDNAGSENDQGVVHSAYEAKKRGMATVLKPQILASNSWPGEIEMLNRKDWDSFFDYYYRWIRHYAFLAEIHGMDALCMGVEFSKATLSCEEDWRKMFRKVRGLYSGNLTYAANWGREFEKLGFWDELDFIGLNSYYPLSKKDNPSDEELKARFDTVKTKIAKVYKKFKKPIVFTEIGFRSINTPWKNPHADGDNSFNDEAQRRCYEIIFEGIKDQAWCNGILWWKFPSYLEYRGAENSAFTPNNKKTEGTVKKWFSK